MTPKSWIISLTAAVAVSVAVQLFAPASGLIAAVSGLFLVVGGTVLTAGISHSLPAVFNLRRLFDIRRGALLLPPEPEDGMGWFLEAADCFRRGELRRAEAAAERIDSPLLRRGTQLVLDGFTRDQIALALQSQIAEERDRLRHPIEVLRAMGGYAPVFGMLGTMIGLVQMLFGLGNGSLAALGSTMGFALLTTVYGLVLANLMLKPLAGKLDRYGRERITRRVAQMQAVMMLLDRQHSSLISQVMAEMQAGQSTSPGSRPQAGTPLRLIASR